MLTIVYSKEKSQNFLLRFFGTKKGKKHSLTKYGHQGIDMYCYVPVFDCLLCFC